jgi:hypothetical protein
MYAANVCGAQDGKCVKLAADTDAEAKKCPSAPDVCRCDGKRKLPSACVAKAKGFSVAACR